MAKTFKCVTLVGTSATGFEDAIQSALRDASASLRNLGWFEVLEQRGRLDNGQIAEFQVKLQARLQAQRRNSIALGRKVDMINLPVDGALEKQLN